MEVCKCNFAIGSNPHAPPTPFPLIATFASQLVLLPCSVVFSQLSLFLRLQSLYPLVANGEVQSIQLCHYHSVLLLNVKSATCPDSVRGCSLHPNLRRLSESLAILIIYLAIILPSPFPSPLSPFHCNCSSSSSSPGCI